MTGTLIVSVLDGVWPDRQPSIVVPVDPGAPVSLPACAGR